MRSKVFMWLCLSSGVCILIDVMAEKDIGVDRTLQL